MWPSAPAATTGSRDASGRRAFVTVDDLGQKTWLGDTRTPRSTASQRIRHIYRAPRERPAVRRRADPHERRRAVRRLDPQYAVALFPFVDGRSGEFGNYEDGDARRSS